MNDAVLILAVKLIHGMIIISGVEGFHYHFIFMSIIKLFISIKVTIITINGNNHGA